MYRPAKRVATADGVATDNASDWVPVVQLEIRATAAAAADGFNAAGRATVVFAPSGAVDVGAVVDVDEGEAAVGDDPWPARCMTRRTVRSLSSRPAQR